ncbi:MAG: metalloregulator ArsR/SmtB family transcription factor [Synechococcaceae cyanobacterium]|nr:metalloregulator ArsR/SmtB family transcription factor [Synechococcaceae cyanobacterium]
MPVAAAPPPPGATPAATPPEAPLDCCPLLRALADPIRLQVIEALAHEERCVCELTAELGLAQSKLSFHLRVLRQAGLIAARQQGRWIYYRLQPEALAMLGRRLLRLAAASPRSATPCPDP